MVVWLPAVFTLTCVTLILTGCARHVYILHPPAAEKLDAAASGLQQTIRKAEDNGCQVEQIVLGAGQGVGVGLGIGVGHGVGVGINVSPDCPDCRGRDELHKVVEKTKEARDTKIEKEALFAMAAMASCPRNIILNPDGSVQ
jgi:hypothetical protein